MNILLFSGSLRTGSYNKKLIEIAYQILSANKELSVHLEDIKALDIPVYDGDIETLGIPQGVSSLAKKIADADGIIIASPEYNGSIAGPLKNLVDWVSRVRPIPWEKRAILLMGTSPGYFGTIRALSHTRVPFDALGAYVYPQNFALPKAGEAFSDEGKLVDPKNEKRLSDLLDGFVQFCSKIK